MLCVKIMGEWWNGLSITSQVYYCIAFASTLFLLIQSIFMFFGFGDDADVDGGDGGFDSDGLSLFTIRGILAFFTIGGWTGVIISEASDVAWLAIIISLVAGTIALFLVALLMKSLMKTQSNGIMQLENAIGKTGTVYLRIPKKGEGTGKITITFSGRLAEIDAISNDEEYKVGATVKVVGVLNDELIVEKDN